MDRASVIKGIGPACAGAVATTNTSQLSQHFRMLGAGHLKNLGMVIGNVREDGTGTIETLPAEHTCVAECRLGLVRVQDGLGRHMLSLL